MRYLLKRGNVTVLKEGEFDADSFANKNKDASALARNTEVWVICEYVWCVAVCCSVLRCVAVCCSI